MSAGPDRSAQRAARLAAVQALYQMEIAGVGPEAAAAELLAGRLPTSEDGPLHDEPDIALFRTLTEAAVAHQGAVDTLIARHLAEGWRLERLDAVARAILRAAVCELWARPEAPSAMVIDEFVEIAKAFFDGPEPGFINAALDACARAARETPG